MGGKRIGGQGRKGNHRKEKEQRSREEGHGGNSAQGCCVVISGFPTAAAMEK